ncbi:MAG: aspartate aminotransferase family protein [Chlorobi bacterium]|nr:aspartate aminotransferase family protein [Chlorobiota bacterium]
MQHLELWEKAGLLPTSPHPLNVPVERAEGVFIYGGGKKYLDLISGIAVNILGHRHPRVVEAVKKQVDRYDHVMVYGDFILDVQMEYAKQLTSLLPPSLNTVFFTNSGSEAIDAAIKLSRRFTGKKKIIAFKNAYHGSTFGSWTLASHSDIVKGMEPLLPEVYHAEFNDIESVDRLMEGDVACVIVEPIQGEAGVVPAKPEFLMQLRKLCDEQGALLVFDEVQTGFGRAGSLFAFEKYGVVPDVLVLAKALGGGFPLGAFISSRKIMSVLLEPPFGHITTYGGHPVSCAAGLTTLKVLIEEDILSKRIPQLETIMKNTLFQTLGDMPNVKISIEGIMGAIHLPDANLTDRVIRKIIEKHNIIVDWFLFAETGIRIYPPAIIEDDQLEYALLTIANVIKEEIAKR